MSFLKAKDAVAGKEGKAIIEIDGEVVDLFYIKKVNAKVTKIKEDVKTVGRRVTGKKTTGYSGAGTLMIYDVTSVFRKKMLEYMDTGRDFNFTIICTNDDPTSSAGVQSVAIYDCNFDEMVMTQLDVDTAILDTELPFTFETAAILQSFSAF